MANNVRLWLCVLLALVGNIGVVVAQTTPYAIALSYVGHTETAYNSSPSIDSMLRRVGVKPGSAWCCAFQSWCFRYEQLNFKITANCQQTYNNAMKVGRTTTNISKVGRQDLIVWRQGQTNSGHIGMIDSVISSNRIRTIEGNTSDNNAGSQRNGDGIFKKIRSPKSFLGRMKVRGYIETK